MHAHPKGQGAALAVPPEKHGGVAWRVRCGTAIGR